MLKMWWFLLLNQGGGYMGVYCAALFNVMFEKKKSYDKKLKENVVISG